MESPIIVNEVGPGRVVADLSADEAREIELTYGRNPVRLTTRFDPVMRTWLVEGRGYVGSVTLSSGRTIRVTTKVPIDSLLFMLGYATSGYEMFDPASAYASSEDFFEIVVREFAHRTAELLRLGLHQGYVEEEDEQLRVLRGRLLVGQQIRRNFVNRHRFACRFVELTPDLPMNQALRLATFIASHFAYRQRSTRDLVEAISRMFGGVSLVAMESHVPLVLAERLDRLTDSYRVPLFLAALIIGSVTLEETTGGIWFSSYLVDMKTLFQQFVAAVVREHLAGSPMRVVAQHHRALDVQSRLEYIPDIEIWAGDACLVVADTKYKKYPRSATDLPGTPSNEDVYQVIVYALNLEARKVVLLYPEAVDDVFPTAKTGDIYAMGLDLACAPAELKRRATDLVSRLLAGTASAGVPSG